MTQRLAIALATSAAAAFCAGSPATAAAACTVPAGTVEQYVGPGSHDNSSICGYDAATGKYSACHLRGWLYKPTPAGTKRPVFVYLQGSGAAKNQSSECSMINYFVGQGFVVWVPYLRGYSDSTTAVIKDETGAIVVSNPNASLSGAGFANSGTYIATGNPTPAATVAAMQDEDDHEVGWAIDYLTSAYPSLVDPNKIVLAGHSYGGITVTLAANRAVSAKLAAIIDMSGGVLSFYANASGAAYVDPQWLIPMCMAVSARQQPMLMFQTMNEAPVFTNPSMDLTDAVASTQMIYNCAISGSFHTQAEMQAYAPVPDLDVNGPWCSATDPSYQCAHTTFVEDPLQVDRWDTQVKDFLSHNGITP